MTGRAKWDAWRNIGKKYAKHGAEAERRYLEVARELGWVPGFGVASNPQEGEVWDEDLGVSVSLSSTAGGGGMGGSVSAMAALGSDDTGEQVLHGFAIQGNVNKITRFLVENPLVDVNQRDEYVGSTFASRSPGDDIPLKGYTALHLACDRGNLLIVKVLIKHGADATIKVCLDVHRH